MIVIPGPASKKLGEAIAAKLGVNAYPAEHRLFPDGESYLRLPGGIDGEKVVLVQTTAPDPDRKTLQLLIMAKTAKDLGATRVIACVPYLAYMRQDKRFLEGEALSLGVILGFMEAARVDDLIVVDAHSASSLREMEAGHRVKVHNLSAVPLLAEYVKKHGYDGAYSLSPDVGAIHLAEAAGKVLRGRHGYFEKSRDRRTGEIEMKVKDLDVNGVNAVVFDDIISSGGTTARAIEGLKRQGAAKVAAACVHALFMPGAEERIEAAGSDLIVSTDTVKSKHGKVTVAGLIADYVKTL
jgi:ribose-phosphate pyrophosphokinase